MTADYVEPENIDGISGIESLAVYRFGDHDVNHYFCRRCGIYPFHDSPRAPGRYRFNLGCVDSIDALSLEITQIDGKSF